MARACLLVTIILVISIWDVTGGAGPSEAKGDGKTGGAGHDAAGSEGKSKGKVKGEKSKGGNNMFSHKGATCLECDDVEAYLSASKDSSSKDSSSKSFKARGATSAPTCLECDDNGSESLDQALATGVAGSEQTVIEKKSQSYSSAADRRQRREKSFWFYNIQTRTGLAMLALCLSIWYIY